MRVINVDQKADREAWLFYREGKVTGTKVKKIMPLKRGSSKPQGFWKLLAENVCEKADGEDPKARGHRLEEVALEKLSERVGLPFKSNCGLWEADDNSNIAFSPDGAEPVEFPTYSAEVKCLESDNHLKFVVSDLLALGKPGYRAVDSIPSDAYHPYREQCIQAFVVNENLREHYFCLYDDRITPELERFECWVICLRRQDLLEEIDAQRQMQLGELAEVDKLIKFLIEEAKR